MSRLFAGTLLGFGLLLAACENPVTRVEQCEAAADCDDGNACTADSCGTDALCDHAPVAVDDDDACTLDWCEPTSGEVLHLAISADDGDACTVDACDASTGDMTHTPVAVDDSDACTVDSCNAWTGEVEHAPLATIDDGDACTDDACDPESGTVTHTALAAIDDDDACTVDACVPATGYITHAPLAAIDDDDACTVDACDAATGAITHTALAAIDDDDACTVDACIPATGFVTHTPLAGIDDGSACTVDACDAASGAITHTPLAGIDDGDACTADACDPASGAIVHAPLPVDDGIACTTDACDDGDITHVAVDAACDDGLGCTLDTCDGDAGCAHAAFDDLCAVGQHCDALDGCVADECYPGKLVGTLPITGETLVDTATETDITAGNCGGGRGPEAVLAFRFDLEVSYAAVLTDAGPMMDPPIVYVREDCPDRGTEVSCGWGDAYFAPQTGQTYYAFIDGEWFAGEVAVWIQGWISPFMPCDPALPNLRCDMGLACKESAPGAADWTCLPSECSDGTDNDGDGFIDYPFEPSCATPQDDDEEFPVFGACFDSVDNDGNGLTDWPADPGCVAAGDEEERMVCEQFPDETVLFLTPGAHFRDLALSENMSDMCHPATMDTNEDLWMIQVSQPMDSLYLYIDSDQSLLYGAGDGECAVMGCDSIPAGGWGTPINLPPGYPLYLWLNAMDPADQGTYTITFTGIIPQGGACDPADAYFTCDTMAGFACVDGFCRGPCDDGMDNDSDGLIDAFDPGCADALDLFEGDDPVPPPSCADGFDNDGDGLTDYPDDPGCERAADWAEGYCGDTFCELDEDHVMCPTDCPEPTCTNWSGGMLDAENGTGLGVSYCYRPADSVEIRARKACESHFGEGNCCIAYGGYQNMQYASCSDPDGPASIHWHWDNHPDGHCGPLYVIGDVLSPGWCGTILGNFLD